MAQIDRTRNTRGRGGLLREEILVAAEHVIDSAEAVAPFSLRGLARAAGISAPSIYLHFTDVQQIEDAVLERAFADLDRVVAAALETETIAAERLVAGCVAYVQYAWAHRDRYRFMFAGRGFAPGAVTTFARIEHVLRDCIDAQVSASTDPHGDAFLIWVGMHGMASLEKPDRPELRRLGPLDRVVLTEKLARTLAKLPLVSGGRP
jgi:AcrR family transcriptional regulator